jgi:hypothetical protein
MVVTSPASSCRELRLRKGDEGHSIDFAWPLGNWKRTGSRLSTKMWILVIAAGMIVLLILMTIGSSLSTLDEVQIKNDLLIKISLDRCGRPSVPAADSVFIQPGETRRVEAGRTCWVSGPTSGSGPGPYIGCLVIPEERNSPEQLVLVSSLDESIGARACDDIH